MKKSFIGLFLASLMLVGCGGKTILEDKANDYYVTGAFAGWGDATEATNEDGSKKFIMEAVMLNDARVKTVKAQIKKATMLYVYEGIELAADQEWGESFKVKEDDAELTEFNGGLTVKVLQTQKGDIAPIYWAQNKESGRVLNITEGALFIAPYQEEEKWEGSGTWGSNLFAKEAGTYDLIFGKMPIEDVPTLFMGLIKVA